MKSKRKLDKLKQKYPRWIFFILSISLPFLLFIIIELLLRLTQMGQDIKLFIKSDRLPGHLVMNPDVSRRYFSQENATHGFMEEFPEVKQKNTIRIFVQGESTAVGFPYLNNGSFHRMLKYRLEHEFPEVRFEIINLGLTAVCSYTLLDFVPEIINQKPDAILIYAGHNEYVGAMGIGATNHYKNNRALTRFLIAFRKLRITQLLSDFIQNIRNSDENLSGKNLMQRMAEKQYIEYGSKAYYAGIDQFRMNMTQLLAMYRKEQIPVFISDLVSNDKDLSPFLSILPDNPSFSAMQESYQKSEKLLNEGNVEEGIVKLRQAETIDNFNAGIQYLLGRSYFAMQSNDSASFYFIRARDYDQLRFRAPEEINKQIATIAHEQGACYIPIKSTFEKLSSGGVIGNEFITEHVHPNLTGYFMLAKAFHDSLVSSPLLQNKPIKLIDERVFRLDMPVTLLDSLYAEYNVVMLKKRWPFFQDDSVEILADDNLHEKLAKQVLLNQKNWLEAFDEIYLDAVQRNNHFTAMKISEALHLEFPYDIRFLDKSARHAVAAGFNTKGAFYFKKAFELTSSPTYAKEAMIAYLKCDEPEMALQYIAVLMSDKNNRIQFSQMRDMTEEIIYQKLLLKTKGLKIESTIGIARNYFLMGNFSVAETYVMEALKMDPNNKEASALLNDISFQKQL